ncbi:F-box/kelch-repeat protein At3g23880-like [Mercurialis annua]|uniref:F-box/kelch-repeat protein At3g23880-like n=1 Tax=Mercurialis annua TaxID=3986 RepID=UPI00215F4D78|nr:F-box/kelch-repeat protein At3g23880-like [Mercurialis annua]
MVSKKKVVEYIPEELQREILAQLPMKSLIRFISASKSMYALITDPSFITLHLRKTRNQHQLFGKIHRSPFYNININSCNGAIISLAQCYGSYHGEVGFPHNFGGFVLSKSNSESSITIPRPKFTSLGSFVEFIGFGFDSMTNDYKLVRFTIQLANRISNDVVQPFIQVCSVRKMCWKTVIYDPSYLVCCQSRLPFVNGACHWIACSHRVRNVILCLSFKDELIREMAMPDCLVGESSFNLSLSVLNESLSLVLFKKGLAKKQCSIWVMKKYGIAESWTKLYNIENLDGLVERFVTVGMNGEILFATKGGEIGAYDESTTEIKKTEIQGDRFCCYFDRPLESLVWLRNENEVNNVTQKRVLSAQIAETDSSKVYRHQIKFPLLVRSVKSRDICFYC